MNKLWYLAVAPLLALVLLPVYAEISITRPLLILADDEGNPLDVSRSTSEVEAMEKASRLPDGTYKLIRPDATIIVDQGVDPLPPIDPPTDPNEPIEPPTDPNEPTEPPVDPNEPTQPPTENRQPVGVNDYFGLEWEGVSVLDNDYDPDGDPITAGVRTGSLPDVGTVTLSRDGYLAVDGVPDGTWRIAYNVYDGDKRSFITEVFFCVTECDEPVDPPVDPPTEPTDPPAPPSFEIVGPRIPGTSPVMDITSPDFDPKAVKWAEAAVTYRPQLPPIGDYSLPEACPSIHNGTEPSVTLMDNEPLQSAVDRLAAKTDFATGGIINIPYNVQTLQCDDATIGTRSGMNRVTVRGILGPNGEMPKFYCRFANKNHLGNNQRGFNEGTIPYKTNKWLAGGGGDDEYFYLLVENIEVDGYRGFFGTGSVTGKYIFRRVWAHHGRGDGFFHDGTAHIYQKDQKNGTDLWRQQTHNLEFHVCGSQISHTGQDNGQHGMYLHGTFGGVDPNNPWLAELTGNGVDSWHKSYIVDNVFHDTNYSSAYKSLDDEQFIVGNKFYHVLDTDPTFTVMPSAMLVDIPACTLATITNNEFHILDGRFAVAFRNRRPPHRGCDMPAMWNPLHTKDANGNVVQPEPIPGPWHTEEWWQSLNKKQFFTLRVENNRFHQDPKSTKLKGKPITNMGTYPNYQSGFGGDSCYLPTPMAWYERSNVISDNNQYFGLDRANNYAVETPLHNYKGRCPTEGPPPGPMPPTENSEYFTIGTNEVYQ